MKLKKMFAAAVAGVAMVSVLATNAFAAAPDSVVDKVMDFADSNGIEISRTEVQAIADAHWTEGKSDRYDELMAQAQALVDRAKAGQDVTADVKALLASEGITVANVKIEVVNGRLVGSATVDGQSVSVNLPVVTPDAHPDIAGAKDANGDWDHQTTATTQAAAAAVSASTGRVIKATGDNAGTALLVSFVALAGVLGLAVRKKGEAF